ncbi:MAG TPA: hypothetical protein PK040_00460 [Anaerolineaceae bacterium]|nr:hypothetical protein [Anaerolineaceae bacterium]
MAKDVQVSFRFSQETAQLLKEISEKAKRSQVNMLEVLIARESYQQKLNQAILEGQFSNTTGGQHE